MRIVVDTNVLVSALISSGTPPGLLYESWTHGDFELVTSGAQIAELTRVLAYERLRPYILPAEAQALTETIDAVAFVIDTLPDTRLSADPDDNAILATAIAAGADLIVTGDKSHLLELESAEGIPIVTPRAALRHLDAAASADTDAGP